MATRLKFSTRLRSLIRRTTQEQNCGIASARRTSIRPKGGSKRATSCPRMCSRNRASSAEEDKDIQAQATGQLHASSNLRLTPERTTNDNIMMRLDSGSSFEIVGWKRVPRVKDAEGDSDVAPKAGSAAATTRRTGRGDERAEEEQETTELWYKVRLSPEISPAPAGWIFGKQVELTVPSDIIYYRTGREFVAWRRLDEEPSDETSATTKTKDVAKESRPGSWVILERSNPKNEPRKIGEPDFDRIYVLGYEKHDQDHYTAYRSPDVEGYLPVRVEGRGANKTFTVRIKDESGQVKDMTFSSVSRPTRRHARQST